MTLSRDLFQLQQFDTVLDSARVRINEIDILLQDKTKHKAALDKLSVKEAIYQDKLKEFKKTETAVGDHNLKIDQNQKRLYGGVITNPKELEDLQLESEALQKYLLVLEERQLEAMLEMEEAESHKNQAAEDLGSVELDLEANHKTLSAEKESLLKQSQAAQAEKDAFLERIEFDDLPTYQSIRASSGGIAVTQMISDSCSACGANIPSAIAQEARSPGKLAFCPTCKRILHPG